jgi:mono/diheme cytochrome c family protein
VSKDRGPAMKLSITALLIAGALVALVFAFVYAGIFNVAADVPHAALTNTIMETVRFRSIATRAKDVRPPPLDDVKLIATGARHYAAMCSGCHLAPDENNDSDMRAGLYPKPPDLTKRIQASPAEAFWVIKHGIKMSGMPAWGITHDDASIWGLVAFLQKLPELTPAQYQALAKTEGESHHQHSHEQEHGTGHQ